MKLLLIQHANSFGGSNKSLITQLDYIKKNRQYVDIDLYVINGSEKFKDQYIDYVKNINNIDISFYQNSTAYKPLNPFLILLNFIGIIFSFFKLYFLFKNVSYDKVYLNSSVLLPYVLFFQSFKNIHTYVHVREGVSNGYIGFRNYLSRYFINLAYGVIFLSNFDKESWGSKKSNSIVVYNSVYSSNFINVNNFHHKKILFLGGFSKIKGLHNIFNELILFFRNNPGWKLIFVGKPLDTFLYKSKIIKRILKFFNIYPNSFLIQDFLHEYSQFIIYRKTTTDLEELYCGVSILIFPASKYHFPRPFIEACSFSIPSVLTSFHPYEEYIISKSNGVLSNYSDFYFNLNYIVSCPDLYQCISEKAYNTYREKFYYHNNMRVLCDFIF